MDPLQAALTETHDNPEASPEYTEYSVQNVFPMTSLQTNRYNRSTDARFHELTIEAGLFNYASGQEPDYLPPHWTMFIHPEGQPYYYRNNGLRIVTEASINRREVWDKLSEWISGIEGALRCKGITPTDSMELFLQPNEYEDTCGYYLANHATRTLFWLDQVSSELIGYDGNTSFSHLKLSLERLYWAHVEYFPMHSDIISSRTIDQLLSDFYHGQVDKMTSATSTFPYSADDSAKFVQILKSSKDQVIDGNITCIVGRLRNTILYHRFLHLYGQETPRLDRDQNIQTPSYSKQHWLFDFGAVLCFGRPQIHQERLRKNLVDDYLVDGRDFSALVSACLTEWRTSLSLTFSLFISNILLASLPSASTYIGTASIITCGMSAVSGIVLCARHDSLEKTTGCNAAWEYMHMIKSAEYGFQPAALVYSLPRALCLWSLVFLTAQVVFLAWSLINPIIAIGWTVMIALMLLGTAYVVFPEDTWPRTPILKVLASSIRTFIKSVLQLESAQNFKPTHNVNHMQLATVCHT